MATLTRFRPGRPRKRTDARDAERALASLLPGIEQRWLEREADAQRPRDPRLSLELELLMLTTPGITHVTLDDEPQD